ncbi:MAG: N-6 DNA methylase [Chlorobi bacterium]|nr:N-6 DNA methylase [Chlorobiota bacterium]MCI0714711.1 N-6 DNA methylase [Chlorobiota bacterium]
MSLIDKGLQEGLIKFDETRKSITYTTINKKYRFTDPEEQVRAELYLQLIFTYGYKKERIDLEVLVPRRTPTDKADIVVFTDDELKNPYIVTECKKPEITDAEFIQAIEQGFGNANSLRGNYLIVTSGLKTAYYNVKDFPVAERSENIIADIPKAGEKKTHKYKYTKGGINGFELELVSEAELVRRFKQAHDTLWGGGERNPSEAFDELDKIIFCKIWDELVPRKKGEPYDFQLFTGEHPERLMSRIKKLYHKGREKDPNVFSDNITITPQEMQTIVGYLAPINLSKTNLDSKGRAFETFLGAFFRGDFGQYFTPRTIVKFITDTLPITNESLVLDPACGSGGFLLYALDKVRLLARNMTEQGYFEDTNEEKKYWHEFAQNNLYGIEINKGISRTAKMNMIIHDDGHTNVINNDALEDIENKIFLNAVKNGSKGYKNFKKDNFDFIITNPPFGSTLKQSEKSYFTYYELAKKSTDWIKLRLGNIRTNEYRDMQNSEILFLERCYNFLKVGGYLAMVVPDGMLTNSTQQYVRNWVEEHFRIVGVVSLPQTAFTATGAGVKSSVIFLKKYDLATTKALQAVKAKTQDELFEMPVYGPAIKQLEAKEARIIAKGDNVIQTITEELENHLKALKEQGKLTEKERKELIIAAKDRINKHKKTEEYQNWKRDITDEYNEKIENIIETLNDEYIKKVKERLQYYPIFMAIAEDIGYDATGRITGRNELEDISKELARFIENIEDRKESFFQLALA